MRFNFVLWVVIDIKLCLVQCSKLCSNHFTQHGGDMEKAADCMDEARSLDTADRYVNCKCAKYQLRANQVQKAEETCGLFTRVSWYMLS